jgi:hypothetical protein
MAGRKPGHFEYDAKENPFVEMYAYSFTAPVIAET